MKSLQFKHESNQIVNQRYQIIDILGEGGIGITYQALNLETKEKVALKVVSLKQHKNWKTIELFEREAEVLKKLNHQGIPKYLDYFEIETEQDKIFYIAQQLAPGKSLDKWVSKGWRTTEAEIKQITKQILDILKYLHELTPPVIHRDIKPQNLIRNTDGKISLVDFGAVQNTYYNTLKSGSTVVGTYGYMAPEHFRAVPATDLYSVGATILYLLTHRNPSELPRDSYDNLKINFREFVQISEGFADWLEKMLQPAVEERFTSAKEALSALHNSQLIIPRILSQKKGTSLLAIGILTITSISFFISHKWLILNRIGYYPTNICRDTTIEVTLNYVKQGGSIPSDISFSFQECLTWAIQKGNIIMIERFANSESAIQFQGDRDTLSPLGAAMISGNKEIVELLIAKGADLNPKIGDRPLVVAAAKGDKELVQLLIANGADLAPDKHYRSYKQHRGKYGPVNSPLEAAIESGNKEIVELLIAKGADVNAKRENGMTALMFAAIIDSSNKEMVELLIAKGADVNAESENGETALKLAIVIGHQEIVKLLKKHGAQ